MKQSFYVYNNGDLKRKDNTLQFTNYDGEKRDIPIERISDIYVMSEMSFNTKFIDYISQYGIPMHFFAIIIIFSYGKLLSERKSASGPAVGEAGQLLYRL